MYRFDKWICNQLLQILIKPCIQTMFMQCGYLNAHLMIPDSVPMGLSLWWRALSDSSSDSISSWIPFCVLMDMAGRWILCIGKQIMPHLWQIPWRLFTMNCFRLLTLLNLNCWEDSTAVIPYFETHYYGSVYSRVLTVATWLTAHGVNTLWGTGTTTLWSIRSIYSTQL